MKNILKKVFIILLVLGMITTTIILPAISLFR